MLLKKFKYSRLEPATLLQINSFTIIFEDFAENYKMFNFVLSSEST